MATRTIVRFEGNQKREIEAVVTPFDGKRANGIITAMSFGDADRHMTDGEIAYTKVVWDDMDGDTCFNDALRKIAKSGCLHCISWESGHNVHCPVLKNYKGN